jgi:hypothetical protein
MKMCFDYQGDMSIVVDPGMLPARAVLEILRSVGDNRRVHVLYEDKRARRDWRPYSGQAGVDSYQELIEVAPARFPNSIRELYEAGLARLLADPRTGMILERNCSDVMKPRSRRKSVFLAMADLEVAYTSLLVWLHGIRPRYVLFQATPHNVFTWALAWAAETLGIRVRYFETSPLPWRYWVVEGLDEPRHVFPRPSEDITRADHARIEEFVAQNARSYDDAIPVYEKERLKSYGVAGWFWTRELKRSIRTPSLLLRKVASLRALRRVTDVRIPRDASLVSFFLHFQPERTSIPEAQLFAQQWLAIRRLSNALPEGWVVIVKEHPSMFTATFDPRFRDPDFYARIAALPNVQFAPLFSDPFPLIDGSQFVATLTGSVGVQALCRGVPVLHFGSAAYRGAPGAIRVGSARDIERAIAGRPAAVPTRQDLLAYLNGVTARSVAGESGAPDVSTTREFFARRASGHLLLLRQLLSPQTGTAAVGSAASAATPRVAST